MPDRELRESDLDRVYSLTCYFCRHVDEFGHKTMAESYDLSIEHGWGYIVSKFNMMEGIGCPGCYAEYVAEGDLR